MPPKKVLRQITNDSVVEETPPSTPATPTVRSFPLPTKHPGGRPKKRQRKGNNPYGRKGKPREDTAATESIRTNSLSVGSRETTVELANDLHETNQASLPLDVSVFEETDTRGNCFFSSLSFGLHGNEEHMADIRRQMFDDFLQRVLDGRFDMVMPPTGLPILAHLEQCLLDPIGRELQYRTMPAYINWMVQNGKWAQVNDSIIAAIVLQKTIVIIHPIVEAGILEHGIRWDDPNYAHRASAFFPDGDTMEMVPLIVPLSSFGRIVTFEDENRTREVENAIVLWSNGKNHFQPFVFTPSVVSAASRTNVRCSERLNALRASSTELLTNPRVLPSQRDAARRSLIQLSADRNRWQQQSRQSRNRRSGLPDRCNHDGMGCWSLDSGHMPPNSLDIGFFGDHICTFCGAWLLRDETSSLCCANGSVKVDDFDREIPEELKHLLQNNAKHANAYNTLLAMAAAVVREEDFTSPDGRVCLLNGKVSHMLSDLAPGRAEPMFNELYCLEPNEAHSARLRMDVFNENINPTTLIELDRMMREHNVLAKQFRLSVELWQRAKASAIAHGRPVSAYTMVIMQKRGEVGPSSSRIRPPAENEVSAVFRMPEDEGLADLPRGLRLELRDPDTVQGKTFHQLRYWDPNMPPLLFPLLFPYGQQAFRKGIKAVRQRQSARRRAARKIYAEDEVAEEPSDEELDEVSEQSDICEDAGDDDDETTQQGPRRNLPKRIPGPKANISMREYYRYIIQTRGPPTDIDLHFPIWSTRFLGQKFLIEMMWVIEHQEAYYSKLYQDANRLSTSKELLAALEKGLPLGAKLGRYYFTPATYQGSKRHMQRAFNDALTIARDIGTPTFFVTFTPNPQWPALKDTLKNGEKSADRADLMCRAFRMARREFWKDVEERGVLGGPGTVIGHTESMEFQEKGMPHLHKLLMLDKSKVDTESAAFVDQYVSAEIMPFAEAETRFGTEIAKRLYEILYPLLIHTCSARCKKENGKCKYGYPHAFASQTILSKNEVPIYRRRSPAEGGAELHLSGGRVVDNRWIVPHNIFMLLKYEAHHCIEIVCGDELYVLQYIFKYLFKGCDMCHVKVTKKRGEEQGDQVVYDYDEFNQVFTCRRMGPFEAFMRLYQEPFVRQSHNVKSYVVHKPEEQTVQFRGGEELEAAQEAAKGVIKTPFMGYFERCAVDEKAGKLTFLEFGKHYRWEKKQWVPYKLKTVGLKRLTRLYPVNPGDHERFAIRLLATYVTGESAFKLKLPSINAYKTVFDANGQRINFQTFVEAAEYHGLLESDDLWVQTLQEASDRIFGSRRFTQFFAQLLLFSKPANPKALFDRFFKRMVNIRTFDSLSEAQQEILRQIVLRRLFSEFVQNGKTGSDFGIPEPADFDFADDSTYDFPRFRADQEEDENDDDHIPQPTAQEMVDRMNAEQRNAYDRIMNALRARKNYVLCTGAHSHRLFWITGEGGSGKSYVIKAVQRTCEDESFNVAMTATVGRAAALLPKGRTVHSTFGLSIDKDAPRVGQAFESYRGALIRKLDLIVIDEVSMMHKRDFESVNILCKDLTQPVGPAVAQMPFAGKVVLLSGDFDQLLTVVPRGKAADQVAACVKSHALWPEFEKGRLHLLTNMRVEPDEVEFRNWQKAIAKGTNFEYIEGDNQNGLYGPVRIPANQMSDSCAQLIEETFPCNWDKPEEVAANVIFAPTNKAIDAVNVSILGKLSEASITFNAIDQMDPSFLDAYEQNVYQGAYQAETLHEITAGTLPHYKLTIKKGAVVMLLKNIDIPNGLANGVRMVITDYGQHTIYGRLIKEDGTLSRHVTAIGRAKFNHKTQDRAGVGGFKMLRTQFPIKLCFACTINKGQGTTIAGRVGLELSSEVFQPGQLYTAVSRLTKRNHLRVYNGRPRRKDEDGRVRNVVWRWE